MLNMPAIQLLHRHEDGTNAVMTEHGSEAHDPERSMGRGELRGARFFRCEQCAEVVVVQPATDSTDETSA